VHRRLLAASLATLVLAVGAWVALGASATAATTVNIGLRSFSISKSASSVRHGSITFHITNHATITHNFRIRVGTAGTVLARSGPRPLDQRHGQAERALLHDLLRHPPVADAHVVPGDLTALLHGLDRDLEELD
jgi:hypothetical protein